MFLLQPDLSFLKSYSDHVYRVGGGERAPSNDFLSEYNVWGIAFRLSSSAGASGCDDAISSHCHRTSLTSLYSQVMARTVTRFSELPTAAKHWNLSETTKPTMYRGVTSDILTGIPDSSARNNGLEER